MTKMLISFPNARPTGYAVGLYDWEMDHFQWLELPHTGQIVRGGVGMASNKNKYYVLLQHPENQTSIWTLNSNGTSHWKMLHSVHEGHSIIHYQDSLLVVDTQRNRIVQITLNPEGLPDEEREWWKYSDYQHDEFHINSIEEFNQEIFVTMFGEKENGNWFHSSKGKVLNVSKNDIILEHLFHPHTLKNVNGNLIFCESRTGTLNKIIFDHSRVVNTQHFQSTGYIRGLAVDHSSLYIGSSARRRKSRSTGMMNTPEVSADHDGYLSNSYIFKVRYGDSGASLLEERCFTQFGSEIYDILVVMENDFIFPLSKTDPFIARFRSMEDALIQTESNVAQSNRSLNTIMTSIRQMIEKNKYEQMVELLQLIAMQHKDAEVHYLLAYCYHHLSKTELARDYYDSALALGFSEYWVKYNRSSVYLQMGLISNAIRDANRCLEIVPDGIDREHVREYARFVNSKLDNLHAPAHLLTENMSVLPQFLIIGTQKGGTTSLYEYLTQHPNVKAAVVKEVHFFDRQFDKGLNWYQTHFPSSLAEGEITGEASPYYLYHPHAPSRIKQILPDAKFIVLLRNPIDRAYSNFKMAQRAGREKLSFANAVRSERIRVEDEYVNMMNDSSYNSLAVAHFSYLKRGEYVEQLERWFSYFPREQFLILNSEELFKNPSKQYRQVLNFLGLPDWDLSTYHVYHDGQYEQDIDPDTMRFLSEHFAPYNQRLFKLIGEEYDWG